MEVPIRCVESIRPGWTWPVSDIGPQATVLNILARRFLARYDRPVHKVERVSLDALTSTPYAEVFEEPRPRAVRLSLASEQRIAPHYHPGFDVVMVVLDGHLEVGFDGETVEANEGDVLRFDGAHEVAPAAMDDTTALLVFTPQSGD